MPTLRVSRQRAGSSTIGSDPAATASRRTRTIAASSPAGRLPRNASVTCSCSRGNDAAAREVRRSPSVRGRPACRAEARGRGRAGGASSPPTLPADVIRLRADSVSGRAARGAAPRRSPASGPCRGRPGARTPRRARRSGVETWKYTSPTGFSSVPPSGPATPVTRDADVDGEPLAHAAQPSPPRPPRTRRRASSISAAGTPSSVGLDLVRVRDDRAREHVARAGHVRQARGDEPAGARLRRRQAEAPCAGRARARSPRPIARPR